MINFKTFMLENYEKISKSLNDDEMMDLGNLIHDKSHIMNMKSEHPTLKKVFRLVKGTKYNKPLYSGISPKKIEDFSVGEIYIIHSYMSFSEIKQVGKNFGKQTKTVLEFTSSSDGFNYKQYTLDFFQEIKKDDYDDYNSMDGDYMIQTAKEEAEWIFNIGTKYKVEKISKEGGFNFIKAKII